MSGCQVATVHIDISMKLWWKLSVCFFFFNLVLEVGFYTYQGFSIAVFMSLLSRRWRCCEPLCSTVIRLDLRLAGARQEERLAAHFPLQPVEMRSLHNIYPRNNDVWFDSLLGVSVQRLFSSAAAAAAAATERHQTEPTSTGKGKRGPQIIVYGWCQVGVFLYSAIPMKCCCVALPVAWLTLTYHSSSMLRCSSG